MGQPAVEDQAAGGGVVLDVSGTRVGLSSGEVMRLRDAAAANAGTSSVARDLSVLLDAALAKPHTIALRAGERRELRRLALQAGLAELAPRLGGGSRTRRL